MKILKNKKENYTVTLEIEEDYSEVQKATEPAYKELSKDVKISGFRKGKVPRAVFERHYGTEMLIRNASFIVMDDCYKKALKDVELEPVDYPKDVDIKTLEEGKPFVFSLKVDVKPEVKVKKYKGLKIEKVDSAVSEDELNKELDRMREYYAEYVVVDREIKDEDLVGYELKTWDGEQELAELTKEKSGTRIGSYFISEAFDKALLGLKLNDKKEFTAKVKDDYFSKNLAGKELKFEVLITEIKERQLPEFNDEFAKKVSGKESVAELKDDILKHQTEAKQRDTESKQKNDLVEELIKENDFEIPKGLVEDKIALFLREMEMDLRQKNITMDKYFQLVNKSAEQVKEEYRPIAEKRAKLELILEQVAEKEALKPSEQEIEEELTKIIKQGSQKELDEETLTKYKANVPTSTTKHIADYLMHDKAMTFVLENAKVK